jgi:hypothetical protein
MADLQRVIGLLHRADWTRLSLFADVYSESDGELARRRLRAMRPPGRHERHFRMRPGPDGGPDWEEMPEEDEDEEAGYHTGRGRLLIAPGGRYRHEYGDEPSGQVKGNDGERGWMWHRTDLAPPSWLPVGADDAPPLRELFCPSELLGEFTLGVRGPVTACGRDAIAVVATPRAGTEHSHGLRPVLFDRLEAIVDADIGILLRREEMFGGQRLSLTELTAVVLDPPEAADRGRFAPPAGSRVSQDLGESLRQTFSGPGWDAAKKAAGLAAGGLGAWIRFAPHRHGQDDDLQAAMPPAEPAAHDAEDRTPVTDHVLYLLYRGGENPALAATLHEWHDVAAMAARVPDTVRAAGHGGVGFLLDSATRGKTVGRIVARLRVSGRDKYRIDYTYRSGKKNRPLTIVCDGQRRWQAYPEATIVGPAAPLSEHIANLVEPSWLLQCRLSGGTELSYRGRRAYQFAVTRRGQDLDIGRLLFFPADAIVDAEHGCLLRLISYAGDRPASWWELRDLGAGPGDPAEFRPYSRPGVPTMEETGNPFVDAGAVAPGPAGYAVRTAVDAVKRTTSAVSATRSFVDDFRGRSRPG